MIAAVQASALKLILGPDVLRISQQIDVVIESGLHVPAYLWSELLAALKTQHPDVMETVQGRVFGHLIEEKINGDSASVRRRKPSGGFPGRQD